MRDMDQAVARLVSTGEEGPAVAANATRAIAAGLGMSQKQVMSDLPKYAEAITAAGIANRLTKKDIDSASGAIDNQKTSLDQLTDAIDEYLNRTTSQARSADDWRAGLEDLATTLRDQTTEWGQAGSSLDRFTSLGLANRQMLFDLVAQAAEW